jgi:hypothetical protein
MKNYLIMCNHDCKSWKTAKNEQDNKHYNFDSPMLIP